MSITVNIAGQVGQIKLSTAKALWPLYETVINAIQSLEDTDISDKKIVIEALRPEEVQLKTDAKGNMVEEIEHFQDFIVIDNGNGFNKTNYASFLEAYSQLKVSKGCKGIGRFLWLKAFETVNINSTYLEDGKWHIRDFDFSLDGINKDDNDKVFETQNGVNQTIVYLKGFKNPYRDSVAYSLESLAKKLIEHCIPYFIMGNCPQIELKDNRGKIISLNQYYEDTYKDSIHQDSLELKGEKYTIYHMLLSEGADKHELHLCANNREVKSFDLKNYIPNMQKKLMNKEGCYYYTGYLAGDYLDKAVNIERSDFIFNDGPLFNSAGEGDILESAVEHIKIYLSEDLAKIAKEKKIQIDSLVQSTRPQYRLLLNRTPDIYDKIPAGLSPEKLDLELYKYQQQWELETVNKKHQIEEKVKQNATTDSDFQSLFDEYCENISSLSKASLAEYVARRKAVIDLLDQALGYNEEGKYSKESRIHSIICPMQITSNDVKYDDMNLWLIDDRLAYHHFLASDQKIKSLPVLENDDDGRMDLTVFDAALSYTADPENINSITIVELKRPQRDDADNDPVRQVLKYVCDIKDGNIKKANGRDLGDMSRVSFYCYVVGDLTKSMKDSAESRGLIKTQDSEGYFGFIPAYGAYVEVISYNKLFKDAKQRNKVLFDKLFEPKLKDIMHPSLIES